MYLQVELKVSRTYIVSTTMYIVVSCKLQCALHGVDIELYTCSYFYNLQLQLNLVVSFLHMHCSMPMRCVCTPSCTQQCTSALGGRLSNSLYQHLWQRNSCHHSHDHVPAPSRLVIPFDCRNAQVLQPQKCSSVWGWELFADRLGYVYPQSLRCTLQSPVKESESQRESIVSIRSTARECSSGLQYKGSRDCDRETCVLRSVNCWW